MGRVDDVEDIPTCERGAPKDVKVGFRGFDWWWSWTHVALPAFFSVGRWYGPIGYENGSWHGWIFHLQIFFWGCNLHWTTKWTPYNESDPVPRRYPDNRRRRVRL